MRTRTLLLTGGLVIATNAVALTGVFLNRTGEPDATIELTERELPVDWSRQEESGLSLRLETTTGWWGPWDDSDELRASSWFDKPKLEQLGFDCSLPPGEPSAELRYGKARRHEAFIVLEYEGDAWRTRLEAMERAVEKQDVSDRFLLQQVELARQRKSRLVPIDVGMDPGALRAKYPDRSRNLIVRAVVGLRYRPASETLPAAISGEILEVLNDEIYVPPAQRRVLEAILGGPQQPAPAPDAPPRYAVTLRFGSRYEPWLTSVAPHSPDGKTHP